MARKLLKKPKKNEDLPSFLFKTSHIPEDINFSPKTTKGTHHLGPIFFGCHEYQPLFHRLNLGHSQDIHKTASSTENILRDAFLVKIPTEKSTEEKKKFSPPGKDQILFSDLYPHKCPGKRKIFVPEPPSATDLGQTKSIIEGEASREIPLYCFREKLDGMFEAECELIWLSDIWEKKRILMSPEVRMAHTHFPKEFVTLKVIGPTIPASITITKIPSKRRMSSQLDLHLKGKAKMKKGEKHVKTEKEAVNKPEEEEKLLISEVIPPVAEQMMEMVKSDAMDKKESETGEIDHQQLQSQNDIAEEVEQAVSKEDVKMKDEEDVEGVQNEEMEEVLTEE